MHDATCLHQQLPLFAIFWTSVIFWFHVFQPEERRENQNEKADRGVLRFSHVPVKAFDQ